MTRGSKALLLIVGVLGCRQPNPEWLGPASAGDTSSATASDGTTMNADASSTATTSPPMCQGDEDCAEPTPLCIDGTCSPTGEGTPCQADALCPATAPLCNPNGECQDGNEGDPCGGGPGVQDDCSELAPFCGMDGFCYDGSPGDPCVNDQHCMSGTCNADTCE